MTMWVVALPVWGERYHRVFENATWPALKAAMTQATGTFTLVVFTDDQPRMARLLDGYQVNIHPIPGTDGAFGSLSAAHEFVLLNAPLNSWMVLLTADLVLSVGALKAIENVFVQGKRVVACMGMRACEEELPTPGLPARELLSWAWDHRHPMTQECTWPDGHSYDLWRMYFSNADGSEVACRLCLPHPLALIQDRRGHGFHPTIDVNLIMNFGFEEMHVVTNPDELALIELSPRGKEFVLTETMRERYEKGLPSIPTFVYLTNARHHWLFNQKIIIRGHGGDCGDAQVVNRMINGK